MGVIKVVLPDDLRELLGEEAIIVEKQVLIHVLRSRLRDVLDKISEARQKIVFFERKYGMSFEEFEKNIKSGKFLEPEHHEDYVEWFFWNSVLKKMMKAKEILLKVLKIENSG